MRRKEEMAADDTEMAFRRKIIRRQNAINGFGRLDPLDSTRASSARFRQTQENRRGDDWASGVS
jgi:hypothetical protein